MPRRHSLPITYTVPHPPDEAFADKYMPNLGHTVKETKVFHWKVQGWKKLEEKLASPEFSCGGHKWYAHLGHNGISHLHNPETHSGGYYSYHSAFPTPLQTRAFRFTSFTPTPT